MTKSWFLLRYPPVLQKPVRTPEICRQKNQNLFFLGYHFGLNLAKTNQQINKNKYIRNTKECRISKTKRVLFSKPAIFAFISAHLSLVPETKTEAIKQVAGRQTNCNPQLSVISGVTGRQVFITEPMTMLCQGGSCSVTQGNCCF